MRVIHLLVIGMLVFAASYVYRIKMESTSRTERVLRLNAEIREQRDAIATLPAERSTEPWRQRLIRSLLYGRNVDRAAKARARVGFAVLAFALVYAVLAGRLVMFAVGADSHGARRTASQDAIATARPDIVDRNGEARATDVKAPSLFGEPRLIIGKDKANELMTATLPDLDTTEVRE